MLVIDVIQSNRKCIVQFVTFPKNLFILTNKQLMLRSGFDGSGGGWSATVDRRRFGSKYFRRPTGYRPVSRNNQ
jgi:hypothetical protein